MRLGTECDQKMGIRITTVRREHASHNARRSTAARSKGNNTAASRLIPMVYGELRRLAGEYMLGARSDYTMQATSHGPYKETILRIFIVCLIICGSTLAGRTAAISDSAAPAPTNQFDLSKLGFQQLSEMARRSGASNLSLDFLDRDHILFTFNPKKLFTRNPDCPATHNDRIVHAAILEISSGKVLKETEWYVHDSRRYLWTLGNGKILLRKLNTLYVVGADLQETPLWTSPKDLFWVSVTPDGKQIISENAADAASSPSKAKQTSKPRVQITFRDADPI
jgi:hypothetical protein